MSARPRAGRRGSRSGAASKEERSASRDSRSKARVQETTRAAERHPRPWLSVLAHPAVVTAIVGLALHLPSIAFDFVRDDHALLQFNRYFKESGALGWLLRSDFWASTGGASGLWRPFLVLDFWLEGRAFGWSAAGFHAVNVALHAACTALVAVLVLSRGTSRSAAWIAGLWFAVMPVHLESVAWIAGRSDMWCALFLAAALILDGRRRSSGRSGPGFLAPAAFALALLAKEAAALGLVLFAIADWCERRDARVGWVAGARWLGPYAIVTLVYLGLHLHFVDPLFLPRYLDPAERLRRQWAGWTILHRSAAFFWPAYPHSPDRMLALPASPTSPAVLVGVVANLALAASVIALVIRRSRAALPLALFWIGLLPLTLGAVTRGYAGFAERFVYVPSMGIAWLLALAWDRWVAPAVERHRSRAQPSSQGIAPPKHSGIAAAVIVGAVILSLIAFSALETARLLPSWKDDGAMFGLMVRRDPDNAKGRVGHADWLGDNGRYDEALAELRIAESLDPRLPELYVCRAVVLSRKGDWDQALVAARRALALEPHRRDARAAEAAALLRLKRLDEAETTITRMLEDAPGLPEGESLWGQYLMARGRHQEALAPLMRAARWITDDPSLSFALGTVHFMLHHLAPARQAFEKTVELSPGFYPAWLRLAMACQLTGDVPGRERALERAAALPDSRDGGVERLRALFAGVQ